MQAKLHIRRKAKDYTGRKMRGVVKRVRNNLKRPIPANFLKVWREFCGYTQEDVIDRLTTMHEAELSTASLSRMEQSQQALDTGWLILLADVLRTTPTAIMSRPPTVEPGLEEIASQVPKASREQASRVLMTFIPKKPGTGTDG